MSEAWCCGFVETVGWLTLLAGAAAVVQLILFMRQDADSGVYYKDLPAGAFKGKTVLLVGASSGIGEELAYAMASRGAKVLAAARRLPLLEKVVKKCASLGGAGSEAVQLDMLDTDSHAGVISGLLKKHERIDILVNNAGRSQRAMVEDTALEVDVGMLALNVTGVISITKALLPHFLQRGAGQIMAGKVGSTISASYSASKHAIQGYFNALRSEVGFRGISVHLACPGPVATPIQEHAFAETAGAKVDTSKPDTTKRMTAARCAHLMAVQLHHGVYEAWMAPQPILLFTALGQYMPTLFTSLQTLWYGPARVKAFRSGDMGYSAVNSASGAFAGILSAILGKSPKPKAD